MGLTAEDCGIVNNSRLTVTFIVDEMKTKLDVMEVSVAIVQHNPDIGGLTADGNGRQSYVISEWKSGKLVNSELGI